MPDGSDWNPQELGEEHTVMELLAAVQWQHLLSGPGEIGMIYVEDPNGDVYYVVLDLEADALGHTLRLASAACEWNLITPEHETGSEAAITILNSFTTEADALCRQLEQLCTLHEAAAYGQARADALEVVDGIDAHDTCGCGEPIVSYEGVWHHVYNDRLRGTDNHNAAPG